MVMDKRKIILVVSVLSVLSLFISGIAIGAGAVYWMTKPVINREDGLTEEQYQFLSASILSTDQMNTIRLRNAWLMLDLMREVEFVERGHPGESGVRLATGILEMLRIGEFRKVSFVEIVDDGVVETLIMRAVNMDNNVYYLRYGRGLGVVSREDGEILYNRVIHRIIDGRICYRHEPRRCN